jgi:hypothetical protein
MAWFEKLRRSVKPAFEWIEHGRTIWDFLDAILPTVMKAAVLTAISAPLTGILSLQRPYFYLVLLAIFALCLVVVYYGLRIWASLRHQESGQAAEAQETTEPQRIKRRVWRHVYVAIALFAVAISWYHAGNDVHRQLPTSPVQATAPAAPLAEPDVSRNATSEARPSIPASTEPSVPSSVEYIRQLSLNGPHEGDSVIRVLGLPNKTISRLRVFVDYHRQNEPMERERISVGEIDDIVKDVSFSFTLVYRKYYSSSDISYFWGPMAEKNYIYPGITHARVVLIAPDGSEQYYQFVLYLGGRSVEITQNTRFNDPGFIILDEGYSWKW